MPLFSRWLNCIFIHQMQQTGSVSVPCVRIANSKWPVTQMSACLLAFSLLWSLSTSISDEHCYALDSHNNTSVGNCFVSCCCKNLVTVVNPWDLKEISCVCFRDIWWSIISSVRRSWIRAKRQLTCWSINWPTSCTMLERSRVCDK